MPSANKFAGEVEIVLDRRRLLKFNWSAFARFQTETGISVQLLFLKLSNIERLSQRKQAELFLRVIGERYLRDLLWAALLHEEPTITVNEVAHLMDQAEGDGMEAQFQYILDRIIKAWTATRGEAAKKKIAEILGHELRKNGTGMTFSEQLSATSVSSPAISGG